MPSLKELRDKVKEIRASQKALTKATAEELAAEIEKHEKAMKAETMKAKRMEALAKAREAKAAKKAPAEKKEEKPKAEPKPKKEAKQVVEVPKAEFVKEHKVLVKELKEKKPKELAKEAVKQEKELAKVVKEKKPEAKN